MLHSPLSSPQNSASVRTESLPDIIIVYGPPLAGKGTQGAFLRRLLPEYFHLDFGTQLRAFVAEHETSEKRAYQTRALRLKKDMAAGKAVLTKDLRFVVEDSIMSALNNGQKLLIEGPGRLLEEARWLSKYIGSRELEVAIFHLHINLEETLRRAQRRWYCPGIDVPFIGYDKAKAQCGKGKPYQRPEDTDPGINMRRYEALYHSQYAAILQEYQMNAGSTILTLDAKAEVGAVSKVVYRYLQLFYGLDRAFPKKK